jgi:cytochrome c oxidase assembly factor CtaG
LWARAGIWQSVKRWQAACFAACWLSLFAALVTHLHELGEHLFTAHMIEHEILIAIAAPLLALSRPVGAFLYALPKAWRHWLSRGAGARWISVPWHWLTTPLNATIPRGRNLDMACAGPVRCHH